MVKKARYCEVNLNLVGREDVPGRRAQEGQGGRIGCKNALLSCKWQCLRVCQLDSFRRLP